MINAGIQHPEILYVLANAGHGSKILIADGNFLRSGHISAQCKVVHLNFSRNRLRVSEVLEVLTNVINIEAVTLMEPMDSQLTNFQHMLLQMLPPIADVVIKKKPAFYEEVRTDEMALIILTGETERYANIILRMGTIF